MVNFFDELNILSKNAIVNGLSVSNVGLEKGLNDKIVKGLLPKFEELYENPENLTGSKPSLLSVHALLSIGNYCLYTQDKVAGKAYILRSLKMMYRVVSDELGEDGFAIKNDSDIAKLSSLSADAFRVFITVTYAGSRLGCYNKEDEQAAQEFSKITKSLIDKFHESFPNAMPPMEEFLAGRATIAEINKAKSDLARTVSENDVTGQEKAKNALLDIIGRAIKYSETGVTYFNNAHYGTANGASKEPKDGNVFNPGEDSYNQAESAHRIVECGLAIFNNLKHPTSSDVDFLFNNILCSAGLILPENTDLDKTPLVDPSVNSRKKLLTLDALAGCIGALSQCKLTAQQDADLNKVKESFAKALNIEYSVNNLEFAKIILNYADNQEPDKTNFVAKNIEKSLEDVNDLIKAKEIAKFFSQEEETSSVPRYDNLFVPSDAQKAFLGDVPPDDAFNA